MARHARWWEGRTASPPLSGRASVLPSHADTGSARPPPEPPLREPHVLCLCCFPVFLQTVFILPSKRHN